ncbi:MAG: hypothetical protein IT371_02825 [Deltaproteobacteria bacterium]|nr:hypothetical protein [Deltaproteobacteria bacterium]
MILVSEAAAAPLFAEVQRWVDRGLREGGAPLESLLYPLSALVPRTELTSPLEPVRLDQLAHLVVDAVAVPPDGAKSFTAANCHFAGPDLEAVSASFNREIDAVLSARPRLGLHSKLHAHPFQGGCFLSAGDRYHGIASPAARQWRERRGLATAILHVVHPDDSPRPSDGPWQLDARGAVASCNGRPVRWRLNTWATDAAGELTDLGPATIVAPEHPALLAARRPPYWATPDGSRWCDAQKTALRAAGYEVSRNLLGRGWRRYLVRAGGRQVLIALPPDFPAAPLRLLEIRRAWCNDFEPMAVPAWILRGSLRQRSLVRLVRHLGAPGS